MGSGGEFDEQDETGAGNGPLRREERLKESGKLVSIIIPCFNGEGFVADAIESALNQTYPHKEVIVVDDGSTDRSLAIIQGYGERVRCISGPNRGGSAARNTGLQAASGELIQFLDADDLLHLDKLERQVPLHADPSIDVVYSDWYRCVLRRPDRRALCQVIPVSDDPVLLALDPQNIQTDSPLHKRASLLRAGGFRPDLPCCQERELMLRLATMGFRFKYLPEILHSVRLHSSGVSADQKRIGQWMKKVLLEHYLKLGEQGALGLERRLAFSRLIMREARVQFRLGNRDLAWECVGAARQMEPAGIAGAYKAMGYLAMRTLGPERAEAVLNVYKRIVTSLRGEVSR